MRVIVTGRQQGKTTHLIKEMVNNPGSIMICASSKMCAHAEDMAWRMYPQVVWRGRFKTLQTGQMYMLRSASAVYVDDLDLFLRTMLGVPIEAVTITGEQTNEDELDRQYLRDLLRESQG